MELAACVIIRGVWFVGTFYDFTTFDLEVVPPPKTATALNLGLLDIGEDEAVDALVSRQD